MEIDLMGTLPDERAVDRKPAKVGKASIDKIVD
jgi:hypothetical protein